jgi:hypothetical protein
MRIHRVFVIKSDSLYVQSSYAKPDSCEKQAKEWAKAWAESDDVEIFTEPFEGEDRLKPISSERIYFKRAQSGRLSV